MASNLGLGADDQTFSLSGGFATNLYSAFKIKANNYYTQQYCIAYKITYTDLQLNRFLTQGRISYSWEVRNRVKQCSETRMGQERSFYATFTEYRHKSHKIKTITFEIFGK